MTPVSQNSLEGKDKEALININKSDSTSQGHSENHSKSPNSKNFTLDLDTVTLQDKIVTEIANQTQDQIPFLMFRDVTEK